MVVYLSKNVKDIQKSMCRSQYFCFSLESRFGKFSLKKLSEKFSLRKKFQYQGVKVSISVKILFSSRSGNNLM